MGTDGELLSMRLSAERSGVLTCMDLDHAVYSRQATVVLDRLCSGQSRVKCGWETRGWPWLKWSGRLLEYPGGRDNKWVTCLSVDHA